MAITFWRVVWVAFWLDVSSPFTVPLRLLTRGPAELAASSNPSWNDAPEDNGSSGSSQSAQRRQLIKAVGVVPSLLTFVPTEEARGATLFPRIFDRQSSLYVVNPGQNVTLSPQRSPVKPEPAALSSEVCLLKLLPVKNTLFRGLESRIEAVSALESLITDAHAWNKTTVSIKDAISELDRKRGQLQPVFNPEDNSMLQISKGEKGEKLVETLRSRLVELSEATATRNATTTFQKQKEALLALSYVGELLVSKFPYEVPSEGKFSYLPRLLGRARVTFSFRRGTKLLGNVTIVADGYTAPITAGNFVDLSIRNFYTGLPIKNSKKRLGSGTEFEVASIPILGSFGEGFYDPLTAKPRRIPLEIIRVEKGSGVPTLSYSQGLTSLAGSAVLEPTEQSRPLLSFRSPGLVAMNHPDKNPNGGSSEFFALQEDSMIDEKRSLLDGDYAPFGYIIDGYDLFQELQQNDIIDETSVDEYGRLNLVKLRRSSFSEVVQGKGSESV